MTDQMTPHHADEDHADEGFAPPEPLKRSDKVKSEIMAGGAVVENDDDELAGGWRGALAMLGIAAALGLLAYVQIWTFVFVVGVIFAIFMHELGHYLTARWTGMKVTQFFLFFGPRLWSFRRGDTEYGVRAIPLGAFVRIIGMNRMDDVEPGDEALTYRQKSFPRRLLVISAGSIMHFIMAIVMLFGLYAFVGERTSEVEPRVIVGRAQVGLPAEQGGIRVDDEIVSFAGTVVASNTELGEAVRSLEPGAVVDVEVLREGETITIPIGLGARADVPPEDPLFGSAYLGVSSYSPAIYDEHSIAASAGNAVTDVFPFAWESTKGVVKVLNPINIITHLNGSNDDLSSKPTTLYGVARVSNDVGESSGWEGMILILVFLNVFVGVFNMFPLLPLDGGHAAIAGYERVREAMRGGKQRYFADVERLMPFAMGVVIVLLTLMMAGLYLDITDPIT